MALRVSGIAVKDNIAVDLAEGGVGRCKGRQHRTVNSRGAVGPGQGLGEVPQNPACILPCGGYAVAEDLITAVLDGRPRHIDEDGGAQGSNDVNAVELSQRKAAAVEIAAVQ